MADRDGGSRFGIGLIVGVALGLAIGFLFAPRSGLETRQLLREKAGAARKSASGAVKKARRTAGEAVKRARAKMDEV
jgi:gas vesicle protein